MNYGIPKILVPIDGGDSIDICAIARRITSEYNDAGFTDVHFSFTNDVVKNHEDCDLVLAFEENFDVIRNHDEIWNKTVFLLEHKPEENPITENEMPFLIWRYGPSIVLANRIYEALKIAYST